MRSKPMTTKAPAERVLKDIRRATRRHFSAEDKIRIVLDGLRGEDSIAELCRREGIAQSLYYVWSKEFLEAGKRRLAGDTARAATSDEVKDLRRESTALKEVVAEQALELRLLKKSMIAEGRTAPRHALRHAAPSQGRGHGLDCLLQSPTAPFDAGLCQSHGVRTKMACQENQPGSIVTASRETLRAGKVTKAAKTSS